MTATSVVFDTWAWWEYLGNSAAGRRLDRKYFRNRRFQVHTSILTLAEVSNRLAMSKHESRIGGALDRIEGRSRIQPLSRDICARSGPLRSRLREADPAASTADALILATARALDARLISGDPAFARQADVSQE